MDLQAQTTFSTNKTTIIGDNFPLTIQINQISTLPKKLKTDTLYLLFQKKAILFIGRSKELESQNKIIFDNLIEVTSSSDEIELRYLERSLLNHSLEQGVILNKQESLTVPENIQKQLQETLEALLLILKSIGTPIEKQEVKKNKPAKARHKWTKEVSEKEFYIDTRDSIATVMWIKRNQMLIKKGATMMKEAPLNKDGSVGFSAKMGDKIRHDYQEQFENFVTTEDIILKSVNEVGLFLYFAGTNSWLEMIDKDGKTLNEWTVVD